MKLASLLNPDFIFLNVDVASQDEAIQLMVEEIYKKYSFEFQKESLIEKIREREKQGYTVLESGISIPHARLDSFEDYLIAFCVPRKAFLMAGKEIRMVVLILVDHTAPVLHLNTLAAIAGLGQNTSLFEKLLQTKKREHFIKVFEDADFRVKKTLNVSDIMSKSVVSVRPQSSLKEVVNLMDQHRASYLPVIDDENRVVGEITVIEILKKGLPDYVRNLENLSFLSSLSSFEDLLKKEDEILASDVMREVKHRIQPDTSILEAALLMVQEQERHLLVEQEGKMLGVLSYMDMLSKVLRG